MAETHSQASFLPGTFREPASHSADVRVAIASVTVDIFTGFTHAVNERHGGVAARAGAVEVGTLRASRICCGAHHTLAILVGIGGRSVLRRHAGHGRFLLLTGSGRQPDAGNAQRHQFSRNTDSFVKLNQSLLTP